MLTIQNNFHYRPESQESQLISLDLITYPSQEHYLKYVKTCLFLLSPLNYIQDIITTKIPAQFKKPLGERQGKSYHHMLASQNITITELTLQNKVGVGNPGEGKISNIKQIDGLIHCCTTLQGDLCRLEIGLHQQTFHFKV